MKKISFFILVLLTSIAMAQAPANYYTTANGLTGFALKTKLKTIITAGHIDQGYSSLWTAYGTTDRDNGIGYENDNTIVDIYSENPVAADPYNFTYSTKQCGTYAVEGDCYNREHLVPQAYFDGVATNPMKNDPFHVMPVDGKVNGIRDNFPFGVVNIATFTSGNGSKKGSNLNSGYAAGYSGVVFEPIDAFKGDIARSLLYFATRYEDLMPSFFMAATVQSKAMFDGSANQVFSPTFLNILLTWNQMDPVSIKEIKRNNAIYAYQGNRNPYIDNNVYATAIWGLPLATPQFDVLQGMSAFPNPVNDHQLNIHADGNISSILLININGQVVQMINKPMAVDGEYHLQNLTSGFYFLKVSTENESVIKKIIVN